MKSSASIRGVGFHVPERVLTNAELEHMVDTSDEWITSRTGIRERRIAAPGEAASDLALGAARKALADAGMDASELTHILFATLTPDSYVPASAFVLQEKLGVRGLMAIDFYAACSGYPYGLELARALVKLHSEARILLVASEVLSSRTNWRDRATCVLFGDGAGAAVITGPDDPRAMCSVLDVLVASDGALGELLTVKGGGSAYPLAFGETVGEEFFIQMRGQEVFKHAVRSMESVSRDILVRNGLTTADVDLVIPHQANVRIIDAVARKLELPPEKVFINVDRYGNTSAASIAIALAEARDQGRIVPGARVLLTAFGGGFTCGASILEFPGAA